MQLHGAQDLARRLRELPKQVSRVALIKAAKAGAAPIVGRAEELAPRDTGQLAQSIDTRFSRRGAHSVVVQIGPDKDAFYGLFLELGTANMVARPFLRPALDAAGQDAVDAVADVLRSEIERAESL